MRRHQRMLARRAAGRGTAVRAWRLLVGGAVGVAVCAAPASAAWIAPAAGGAGTDRAHEMMRYYDVALANDATPLEWTGSQAACDPGSLGAGAATAMQDQINYYRSFYGLGQVTLDAAMNAEAQKAALIMSANGRLSHSPGADWACHTAAGETAAGRANLAMDWEPGAGAFIGQYMRDPGASNTSAGHRRWVLNPVAARMGAGATDVRAGFPAAGHALVVFGYPGTTDTSLTGPEWMPYPAQGYFPGPLEPEGRWSLSASDSDTDFSAASVSMTGPGGAPVTVVVNPTVNGYGPNTLVWEAAGLRQPAIGADVRYDVTVANVRRAGVTLPPHSYSVTLFAPDRPLASAARPSLSGTPRAGQALTAQVSAFSPTPDRVRITWRRDGAAVASADVDAGAAAPSYAVTAADAGARISVQVTAEREHYAPTTVASDATAAVTARFGPVARPRLVGTARVRGVVRVRLGGVVPRPDRISVAWRRGTTRLAARGATYRVTARDRGRRITAVVTYRRVGFDPLSVATTATRPVR